jgi:glycosyltransferase involved in cell wall biosynthesis
VPMVSIIIPVYNAVAYISRCLDSILNQTYRDFEIVCINDASTDQSCEIIQKYQNQYPGQINLQSQENSGAGESRNHGIRCASGKYLFFVDNDDYIDKDYIETFVEAAEKNGADMVLGGYRHVDQNGKCFFQEILSDHPEWAPFKRIAPWGRIYRRKFLTDHHLEFLKSKIGEDFYLNARAAVLSSKTVVIEYTGYNWYYNSDSISNNHHLDPNLDEIAIHMLESVYYSLEVKSLTEGKKAELEYLFVKFIVYYLMFYGRKFNSGRLLKSYQMFFDALKAMFPQYRKNKLIRISSPKGEDVKIRLSVFFFVLLDRFSLCKPALKFYAKGKNFD